MKTTTGSLIKRGSNYYCFWRIKGKAFCKALRDEAGQAISHKADAERAKTKLMEIVGKQNRVESLRTIQHAIDDTQYDIAELEAAQNPELTIKLAWKAFERSPRRDDCSEATLKEYGYKWKRFLEWIEREHPAKMTLRDVDNKTAEDYMSSLNHGKLAPATYNFHLMTEKYIFSVLKDDARLTVAAAPLAAPPFDHPPSPPVSGSGIVLHEHDPQHLDLMQPRQEPQIRITAGSGIHRRQQGVPVPAVSQRQLILLRRRSRHPPGIDPRGVPLVPRVVQVSSQPVRGGHREGLQACPHRFPGQLQPVQVPYRGDHMGGIGAHLPARLDQPAGCQLLQQRVQHHLIQAAASDAGPELTQDRVVEPGIGQAKAESVFPVDPGAHRLGRLPVGQVLRHLEDRHQGQPARRPARLAPFPVGTRELLIGQPLTELITDHQPQRTLPLTPVHRRNGRDHLRCGLRPWPRLDRHHRLHLAAGTRGRRPQPDHPDHKIQNGRATPRQTRLPTELTSRVTIVRTRQPGTHARPAAGGVPRQASPAGGVARRRGAPAGQPVRRRRCTLGNPACRDLRAVIRFFAAPARFAAVTYLLLTVTRLTGPAATPCGPARQNGRRCEGRSGQ